MNTKKIFIVFNAVAFYIYWWLSLFGTSKDNFYIGPLVAVFYFIFHFIIVTEKMKDFKCMLFCICIGIIFESILLYSGFLKYKGFLNHLIVPFWVITLWAGYALTAFHSFKYMKGRYFVSLIIGGFIGPFIHISGNQVGAIIFNYDILTSYFVLMAMWSVFFPLMNYISVKIDD